jgi:hypothetical protein
MSRNEEGGGRSRGIMEIKSIVLRAVECFSNFDPCSKASAVIWLCSASGDAISVRAKDLSLKLCSEEQVNCWSRRLGGFLLDWTQDVVGDANTCKRPDIGLQCQQDSYALRLPGEKCVCGSSLEVRVEQTRLYRLAGPARALTPARAM